MEHRLRLESSPRFVVASAGQVRSTIGHAILREPTAESLVGSITLHPHQRSAVERLRSAIDLFNGALLCDDVGMGKTYVAIAVARDFKRRLVVAPSALIPMWQGALEVTSIDADLITFEALSRVDSDTYRGSSELRRAHDFVVIDEAHHVRNPRTNRYFALESLVREAKVLLLSATPIHNRRHDLVALLSLFLGSRARVMTSAELAMCVVRRQHVQLERAVHIPKVHPAVNHQVPDDPATVERLMELPPPIPFRDGGLAGALIGRGLVHQWASSEAALREALRRRISRAIAMCASLEAGTYPTASELETWVYGEGALQLGFAELLASPVVGHEELLVAVRAHLNALEAIANRFSSSAGIDAERARIIAGIRTRHPKSKIVAFAQYAETVSMLFRRLSRGGNVALLTSHGARVAGGSLSRAEAINRFAPRATSSREPLRAESIELLLTTDLLSEGVNLQDAAVVIHLDIPWTLARMEQRVGRVARLGSSHAAVTVHVLRPPASATEVLRSESIVQRKWKLAKSVVGTSARNPWLEPKPTDGSEAPEKSEPEKTERLRSILGSWIGTGAPIDSSAESLNDILIVATIEATRSGFVAAASVHGAAQLLVVADNGVSTDLQDQIDVCAAVADKETETDSGDVERALEIIQRWFITQSASAAAGLEASNALRRREITSRIDASIEDAPPHLRASRLAAAAQARVVATTPQCAAVERELDLLSKSELPADEWLAAVANLDVGQATRNSTTREEPLRVHAILLLRAGS